MYSTAARDDDRTGQRHRRRVLTRAEKLGILRSSSAPGYKPLRMRTGRHPREVTPSVRWDVP